MSEIRRFLMLASAALLVAGCATNASEPAAEKPAPAANEQLPEGYFQTPADAYTRAKAHTELAAAYYGIGNMGVALQEARIAVASDPNYAPAYNIQALVNMDLKDNAAAEANFQRGLKLAPNDPDLNHNFGWFLCQTGRVQQSMPYFRAALSNPLYSSPSRTYAAAGRCLLDIKQVKQATEYFERALRLDPNNVNAMLPFADALLKRGQFEEAREIVERYNRASPPSAEALWLAVRIERKLGNRVAENSYAAQLRLRFPKSAEYQALQRGDFE
ncbi:MAG: type IV pilus biogenesis/stability protein PilW [Betaproteobacteria bacterium]|jgi:type IV pilus assembly protein PilF|nr:type IV pilus biogenesis/stability protein PilW [Betaproteobacteria bacterium]